MSYIIDCNSNKEILYILSLDGDSSYSYNITCSEKSKVVSDVKLINADWERLYIDSFRMETNYKNKTKTSSTIICLENVCLDILDKHLNNNSKIVIMYKDTLVHIDEFIKIYFNETAFIELKKYDFFTINNK